MELDKVIEQRQSIRKYEPCDIPRDDLEAMVKAAGMAPSANNDQNWHFVAINNKEVIKKIAEISRAKWQETFDRLTAVNEEKGRMMTKFSRHFFFFYEDASAIVLAYSNEIENKTKDILTDLGEDEDVIRDFYYRRNNAMQNVGAALENLTLKAIDLGYGSCWLSAPVYTSNEIDAYLKEEHGFDPGEKFLVAVLSIGKPAPGARSPKKKPLEEILTVIS